MIFADGLRYINKMKRSYLHRTVSVTKILELPTDGEEFRLKSLQCTSVVVAYQLLEETRVNTSTEKF